MRIAVCDDEKKLRKAGSRALIVFVTAHPDFVFQGYEVQAFNYILKPYQEKKIKEVLAKAPEEAGQNRQRYFVIEHRGSSLHVLQQDILYFKSEGRSVIAVTENGQETFYGRLDEVEGQLHMRRAGTACQQSVQTAAGSRICEDDAETGGAYGID